MRNRSVGIYMRCYTSVVSRKVRDQKHCQQAAQRFDHGPDYRELLNTTFALCPAGRSPASYRMNEVMAAGAIPIFLSGEGVHVSGQWTRGAYVPPFSDAIQWPTLSLHLAGRQLDTDPPSLWGSNAHRLLDILGALPDERIEAMQRGVREAWQNYLRPERVGATLWAILRRRASFFDAPYDVERSAIGLHISDANPKAFDTTPDVPRGAVAEATPTRDGASGSSTVTAEQLLQATESGGVPPQDGAVRPSKAARKGTSKGG